MAQRWSIKDASPHWRIVLEILEGAPRTQYARLTLNVLHRAHWRNALLCYSAQPTQGPRELSLHPKAKDYVYCFRVKRYLAGYAGGPAQVRIPLIVQPIAELHQRRVLGVGTIVPTTPYKSGSQGNRRSREASISEEASEGSVGNLPLAG